MVPRDTRAQGLFGFGDKKDDPKAREKEEAFQAQQRLLEARRTGRTMDGANARRAKVSDYLKEERAAKKKAWREGKNVVMPGQTKSTIDQIREAYGTDNESNTGIVVPLAPFGIPKYDQGGRFDLQAPYADEGYVDPEDQGGFSLKRLFGGGKKKKSDDE